MRTGVGYSRHHPALPLYTREDAEACLPLLRAEPYGSPFTPADGVSARFTRAGHILGSGCLSLEVGAERLPSRATWAGPSTRS